MSIHAKHINYTYNKDLKTAKQALYDINLVCEKGMLISVVGRSGSGKSTLMKHLNGLLKPDNGIISVDGIPTTGKEADIQKIRSKVGFLFQYPEDQIFAETVCEELEFAPNNFGIKKETTQKRIEEIIHLMNFKKDILDKNPLVFSGGNKRKVAIASILSYKPEYLILDEPTAGLDGNSIDELFHIIDIEKKSGTGIIHVTHDIELALETSDRIVVMDNGHILNDGNIQETMEYLCSEKNNTIDIPPILKISAGLKKVGKIKRLASTVEELVKQIKDEEKWHTGD